MKEDNRKVIKSLMMITQIGITMMVPIFLCVAFGTWLNRMSGMQIWVPLMAVLGIGAGFRNAYMLTKSFYEPDMKKENEKLKYMEDLKNYRELHPDEDFSDVMEGKKKRYPEHKGR